MPSAWQWWAGYAADVDNEGFYAIGNFESREQAIEAGRKVMPDCEGFTYFYIIEARSSTDTEYEGADMVPFTHLRHGEMIKTGVTA